jgi:alginate O-acetyltransferase complex protein AlgI
LAPEDSPILRRRTAPAQGGPQQACRARRRRLSRTPILAAEAGLADMYFTSLNFGAFFVATFIVYYLPFSRRCQPEILIAASLFIYWFEAGNFIFLLLISSVSTAVLSYLLVAKAPGLRRWTVFFGVAGNLLLLGFFKYKSLFLADSAPMPSESFLDTVLHVGLPIGISFYTFHGISLILDTYRDPGPLIGATGRRWWAHLTRTLLYMSFFPQLVAGPIAKGKFLFPQIGPKRFAAIDWQTALDYLICGYFLKSVLADNLQQFTAPMGTPAVWSVDSVDHLSIMMLAYSAQIYADFAGYSLIALGLAKLLGYDLPQNFNNPYLAASFSEFWRRWHMSLSSWLRDYLYIPLGGNRRGALRTYANLFIVMALGGLWHGAGWKFAAWGAWHGIALMAERAMSELFPTRPPEQKRAVAAVLGSGLKTLRILAVFCYVTIGWLLFRLDSFTDVIHYLARMIEFRRDTSYAGWIDENIMLLLVAMTLLYQLVTEFTPRPALAGLASAAKPMVLAGMVVFIVFGGGDKNAFIYFQF